MILTPKIVARIVAIVLLGVLLQLTFFSQVALFHVSPDVLPALVVSLGLLGGTMTGAVSGFSVGFLLDCLLVRPLGGASLVLLGVGYGAGLFRERYEIHSSLGAALLCAAGTLIAELGFGAVQLMLGIDSSVSLLVIRDILVKCLFAFLLGWAIFLGVRRALRPALVEEPVVRRGPRLRLRLRRGGRHGERGHRGRRDRSRRRPRGERPRGGELPTDPTTLGA
jgi:rod shape-determining protein MreD